MIDKIKMAYAFAEEKHKKFLVVLIPCKEMVYGEVTGMFDMEAAMHIYKELERAISREDIPCFNSTAYLVDKERQDGAHLLFLPIDPHLNEYGNAVLAEGIVQYMREHSFL